MQPLTAAYPQLAGSIDRLSWQLQQAQAQLLLAGRADQSCIAARPAAQQAQQAQHGSNAAADQPAGVEQGQAMRPPQQQQQEQQQQPRQQQERARHRAAPEGTDAALSAKLLQLILAKLEERQQRQQPAEAAAGAGPADEAQPEAATEPRVHLPGKAG